MSSSIRNFISLSLSRAAAKCLKVCKKCLIIHIVSKLRKYKYLNFRAKNLQKTIYFKHLSAKNQMRYFLNDFQTQWSSDAAFKVGRTWMFDFLVSGYWIWSLSSHCFQFSPTSSEELSKHMMSSRMTISAWLISSTKYFAKLSKVELDDDSSKEKA